MNLDPPSLASTASVLNAVLSLALPPVRPKLAGKFGTA